MKKIEFILLLLICLWTVPDLFGQSGKTWVEEREDKYDKESRFDGYVDTFADTLLYKGDIYYFRRTPLFLKNGYTSVFEELDVKIDVISFGQSMDRLKGYTLTWIIRNDSLFIKNIYPAYSIDIEIIPNEDGSILIAKEVPQNPISCDSVKSRVERFVGNKFKDDLLYVDWITGDFGVIDSFYHKYSQAKVELTLENTGVHLDGRLKGFLLTFKNGELKKIKKDNRKIKN
jgi:hypothetical protein